MFWSTLIPLLFIAAVLYVAYKYRRVARERRDRSDERTAAMLAMLQKHAVARAPAPEAGASPNLPGSPQTAAPAPIGPWKRRARLLTDTQHALYLVLRAAMPDHTVMSNVRIVDLLDPPPAAEALERDTRLRELARERLDFVVCSSELIPLAGIVVYESGLERVPDETLKVEALREIGVRFLRFRADSLPRAVELRALALG